MTLEKPQGKARVAVGGPVESLIDALGWESLYLSWPLNVMIFIFAMIVTENKRIISIEGINVPD